MSSDTNTEWVATLTGIVATITGGLVGLVFVVLAIGVIAAGL